MNNFNLYIFIFLVFLKKMSVDLLTSLLNSAAVKHVCKCVFLFVKSWIAFFFFLMI